jgi:hypothetical protein
MLASYLHRLLKKLYQGKVYLGTSLRSANNMIKTSFFTRIADWRFLQLA